ncbi:MAG: hypothetical protein GWP10_19945 [Nitrospiraceae bacterium]|nr:hypothetical protein [Nitrospiraceae bacterium]
MVVGGEHNDDADVDGGGRVTSLDALMVMQAAVWAYRDRLVLNIVVMLLTMHEMVWSTWQPAVVFEIAYEEIQKSPHYASGYALRFPRLVRVRFDKTPEDADSVERVERLAGGG